MKASLSKSQLPIQKHKTLDSHLAKGGQTKRKKSQSNSNRNKEDHSKIIAQIEQESKAISQVKSQQLFGIIETFYNTLCSLPMEMLINSADPQFWLNQQQQTFKQLSKKLQSLAQDKDYEYFNWKLQSVQKLLDNICENMGMLQRITNLKGYYSGTDSSDYHSRNSSAIDSQGQAPARQSFKPEMISYDQYEIRHNKHQPRSASRHSSEIMAETVQSDEQSSEERQQPLIHSEFFQKKRKREVLKQGQNHDTANHQHVDNIGFFKITSKQTESKDKTLAKLPISKESQSCRTVANYNPSNRFLEDRLRTGINCLSNDSNNLTKNQQSVDCIKQQNTLQSLERSPKADGNQQYILMIKQLRFDLLNKDKQIEKLLIAQQEYEQSVEIFREREKQKDMQMLFLKESVTNCQREKEKLQSQIKGLIEYQEELKETIRFERDRNKKQNKEKEKMQEKYYEEATIKQQLVSEITRLKQENRQCKRNQRVMKQKLDVYKKKYFQAYGEIQQSKQAQKLLEEELQECRQRKKKSQSRYEEVKQAIEHHKEQLFDESF